MSTRREFLAAAGAAVAAGTWAADKPALPRLKKAVKYGMVRTDGTPQQKFELLKALGFQGVEIDSPSGLKLDELVAARDATGIAVHGVVDSVHWNQRLSDPNEEVRAKGLAALRTALIDAKKVGADTVLLVPGKVTPDASYDQCWERSSAEVKKVLPDADKLGVKIAIEVVWNDFLTKPEQLIEYVDQFKTPTVGAYFDASNMLKYGVPAAEWVRKLGKRMLKLDFKGYDIAKGKAAGPGKEGAGFAVGIGEGSEDWPEVLKACGEVGYAGWATAEVKGGDEKWLRDVSERMDKILQLK